MGQRSLFGIGKPGARYAFRAYSPKGPAKNGFNNFTMFDKGTGPTRDSDAPKLKFLMKDLAREPRSFIRHESTSR